MKKTLIIIFSIILISIKFTFAQGNWYKPGEHYKVYLYTNSAKTNVLEYDITYSQNGSAHIKVTELDASETNNAKELIVFGDGDEIKIIDQTSVEYTSNDGMVYFEVPTEPGVEARPAAGSTVTFTCSCNGGTGSCNAETTNTNKGATVTCKGGSCTGPTCSLIKSKIIIKATSINLEF